MNQKPPHLQKKKLTAALTLIAGYMKKPANSKGGPIQKTKKLQTRKSQALPKQK